MNISLLAYSSNTGLGYQTEEFYLNMKPFKTLLCDISDYNKIKTHHDRFPDAKVYRGFPKTKEIDWLLTGADILFVAETPLNYELFAEAKKRRVKIIQQPNYEFFDYFNKPNLPKPDLLALPTLWNREKFKDFNSVLLPVPVNRKKFPRRKIKKVKTFIHIIGRPTYMDRNGTLEYLEAVKRFSGDYRFIIYYQTPTDEKAKENFAPVWEEMGRVRNETNLQVFSDIPDNRWLYVLGDCLVLPRKYGGLSLPCQEALSCGLPVVMTDISPNNLLLPHDWLCEVEFEGSFKFHANVDVYKARVNSLVEKMELMTDKYFYETAREKAEAIADYLDWKNLKDYYLTVFNDITDTYPTN